MRSVLNSVVFFSFMIVATAHAYTVEAIRHAIDNGVDGIEHGNLIDEATAKLFVSSLPPCQFVFDL